MTPIKLFDGAFGRDRTGRIHGPMKEGHCKLFTCGHLTWYLSGAYSVENEKAIDIVEIVPAPRAESGEEKEKKMTLAEALKTGKPIRRPGWGYYIQLCNNYTKSETLRYEDLLADDWELQKEEPKPKVTRYRYRVKGPDYFRDDASWHLNEQECIDDYLGKVKILKVIDTDVFDE